MTNDRWPASLWLVRHGESAGNVARDAAEAGGLPVIDLATRDMDVPLSHLGEAQARALGHRLAGLDDEHRPTWAITSPYVRAAETGRLALLASGCAPDAVEIERDERLREREFGILDRLTRAGIESRFPEQAAARAFLGKFYHRPPGGESWTDVALRVRSFIDSVGRQYANERVLIVTHQVVVLVFRYVLESLSEPELLAIDRAGDVANCSITAYEFDATVGRQGGMKLRTFNDVTHLREEGQPVTTDPDARVAPR